MPPTRLSAAQPDEDARLVRLLGLLLTDSLETAAKGRGAKEIREAREWICAPSDDAPYSFERVCAAFGLPPDGLRRRVGLRRQAARRRSVRGRLRRPSER